MLDGVVRLEWDASENEDAVVCNVAWLEKVLSLPAAIELDGSTSWVEDSDFIGAPWPEDVALLLLGTATLVVEGVPCCDDVSELDASWLENVTTLVETSELVPEDTCC